MSLLSQRLLFVLQFAVLMGLFAAFSGCALIDGALRDDFRTPEREDAGRSGGQWPDGGMLDGDRAPASLSNASRAPRTWVSDESREIAQRDAYRKGEDMVEQTEDAARERAAQYKKGVRAKKEDFIDESQSEGSLWASDGQTNYFFTKNKVRSTGDLISIKVENDFLKDIRAETLKTLNPDEMEYEIDQAKKSKKNAKNNKATASVKGKDEDPAAARAPAASTTAEGGDEEKITPADIDFSRTLELKEGDTVMAEVVERYGNGNYKIRGSKRIPYRGSYKLLRFMAVAKGTEIEDETIASGKLYEYRLDIARQ